MTNYEAILTKPKFSMYFLHSLQGQFVGCHAFISDLKTETGLFPLI